MATSEKQILANRENGKKSRGAVTAKGKAIASMNALRHGVLSTKLILQGEKPGEYYRLLDELITDLKPHGITEHILVEKVAVAIWKQRRLVAAETARIDFGRQPRAIFKVVNQALGRGYTDPVNEDHLEPISKDHLDWYKSVQAELVKLIGQENITITSMKKDAPKSWEALLEEAEEEGMTPEQYVLQQEKGVNGWVAQTFIWCSKQIDQHKNRPELLTMYKAAQAQKGILADDVRESCDRYAAALDGQLYKAMKELRQCQEYRKQNLETIQVEQTAA